VARAWGLTPSFIGVRHERLAHETSANLLIVRKHVEAIPPPALAAVPSSALASHAAGSSG
jgi:hypothetical protein